jgi:hypothetical protein
MRMTRGVACSLLWLCAGLQPLPGQGIRVTEVQRTAGNRSSPFGTIGGMLEASSGVVLISDDVNKAVWRWELGSQRVSRFARDGRGPGEVMTPVSFARRPAGGFALYDPGHASVLFFDPSLAFERTARLSGGIVSNPKSMAVLSDGSVVISGGRLRDPRDLHRFSAMGDWLESFGDPSPRVTSANARIQSAGGAVRALSRGLLFSHGAPLRIDRFTDNSFSSPRVLTEDVSTLPPLTEEVLHGTPRTVEPGLGLRPFLWWHDRSTGVFTLADGRMLNVITRYHRGDSVWDLYTADGNRLQRVILPRAWYVWDLTPSGRLLASYRDPETDEHIAVVLILEVR